jgi:HNH endonuclease
MTEFRYPTVAHVRRHGPAGYVDWPSYRPWLRDEFSFRCVYCLRRERWGASIGEFAIDHLKSLARHARLAADYDNLLYTCLTCNLKKRACDVSDPSIVLTASTVQVADDGTIAGHTADARRVIRQLDLDSPEMNAFRQLMLNLILLAERFDRGLYQRLLCYPDDLPDLAALRPPGGNSRPGGIADSYHARRARGELPDTY